jgi:hypothetical protein
MYTITTLSGKQCTPPAGRYWKNVESEYLRQCQEGRMWFGKEMQLSLQTSKLDISAITIKLINGVIKIR